MTVLLIYLLGTFITLWLIYRENQISSDSLSLPGSLILSLFSWVYVALIVFTVYIPNYIQTVDWYKKLNNKWKGES